MNYYSVEEADKLTPLELLNAHNSNRLPQHYTVRDVLGMVHAKLRVVQTMQAVTVAERIDEVKGDMSWRELAHKLHTDHAYLAKVRNGTRNASAPLLRKLQLIEHTLYTRASDHGETL